MEYRRLKDIDIEANSNNRVYILFCACDVEVRQQKNGGKFISLNMCDRGIKVNAKIFSISDNDAEKMQNGKVYAAAVDIKPYNGKASCIIYNFDVYEDDPKKYAEVCETAEAAYSIIQEAFAKIKDPVYRSISQNLVIGNWTNFSSWSAAKSMHHSALSGLMAHTGEVVKQAELLGDFWNSIYGHDFVNMDLLLAGALLHDIGKLHELDVDTNTGITKYSTEAALIPHIVFGVQMIWYEACKLGIGFKSNRPNQDLEMETEKLNLLTHLILSHHGIKEYGSPIEPSCPEALILSMADDGSAKMFRMHNSLKQLKPGAVDETYIGGERKFVYKSRDKQ